VVEDIVVDEFQNPTVRPVLGKRQQAEAILKMKSYFEGQTPNKRMKTGLDLNGLIAAHGSSRVIGMLQAYTLIQSQVHERLFWKERGLI
jgi:hypothetical protein